MLASENDALPGGKVGGIGDVVREMPPALAEQGCELTVLTPAYGVFHKLSGANLLMTLNVNFQGRQEAVRFYEVDGRTTQANVRHWVLEHPLFSEGGVGQIYCDDPPNSPFASDASKFALFCGAVAEMLVQRKDERPDVLHLHDWHAAFLLILRQFHPDFQSLQDIPCVYTIHNLALQGVRPFTGHDSSLAAWYPGLRVEAPVLADPRWPDCLNPMAVGIRLADRVHVVSPTYAEEIMLPSAVNDRGYYGGEGLEADLLQARADDRLVGILNGCDYSVRAKARPKWDVLVSGLQSQLLVWSAAHPSLKSAHFVATERLREWSAKTPETILTSVGRLTEQKAQLLYQPDCNGVPALYGILEHLGEKGVYIFLGSGDPELEQFLLKASARFTNFIFLNGYSDDVSSSLYSIGDLFLMPSSFEPCGISQMLAMRAGQPCLVHHVGGLRDTVEQGVDGFAFSGDSLVQQADALVETCADVLKMKRGPAKPWKAIGKAAKTARFTWQDSIGQYIDKLYRPLVKLEL